MILRVMLLSVIALSSSDKPETIDVDLSQAKRDARALELYLSDRKDHKEHCPKKQWEQPPLSKYKETLISHLPNNCKN